MAPRAVADDAKIPCTSIDHFEFELSALASAIAPDETEDNWEKMERAILRFAGITRGGAYKLGAVYVEAVGSKGQGPKLVACMLSDRGKLSGVATDFLATMAPRLSSAFQPLVPIYAPVIIRLLARPNKVYLRRAERCLLTIITFCPCSNLLPHLLTGIEDKSDSCRQKSGAGIEKVMEEWDRDVIGTRGIQELEGAMKKMATDKDPEVRRAAKKSWEAFANKYPERVDAFSAPLTPTVKKYLAIREGGAGAAKPAARRPIMLHHQVVTKNHHSQPPATTFSTGSLASAPASISTFPSTSRPFDSVTTRQRDAYGILSAKTSTPIETTKPAISRSVSATQYTHQSQPPQYLTSRPIAPQRSFSTLEMPIRRSRPLTTSTSSFTSTAAQPQPLVLSTSSSSTMGPSRPRVLQDRSAPPSGPSSEFPSTSRSGGNGPFRPVRSGSSTIVPVSETGDSASSGVGGITRPGGPVRIRSHMMSRGENEVSATTGAAVIPLKRFGVVGQPPRRPVRIPRELKEEDEKASDRLEEKKQMEEVKDVQEVREVSIERESMLVQHVKPVQPSEADVFSPTPPITVIATTAPTAAGPTTEDRPKDAPNLFAEKPERGTKEEEVKHSDPVVKTESLPLKKPADPTVKAERVLGPRHVAVEQPQPPAPALAPRKIVRQPFKPSTSVSASAGSITATTRPRSTFTAPTAASKGKAAAATAATAAASSQSPDTEAQPKVYKRPGSRISPVKQATAKPNVSPRKPRIKLKAPLPSFAPKRTAVPLGAGVVKDPEMVKKIRSRPVNVRSTSESVSASATMVGEKMRSVQVSVAAAVPLPASPPPNAQSSLPRPVEKVEAASEVQKPVATSPLLIINHSTDSAESSSADSPTGLISSPTLKLSNITITSSDHLLAQEIALPESPINETESNEAEPLVPITDAPADVDDVSFVPLSASLSDRPTSAMSMITDSAPSIASSVETIPVQWEDSITELAHPSETIAAETSLNGVSFRRQAPSSPNKSAKPLTTKMSPLEMDLLVFSDDEVEVPKVSASSRRPRLTSAPDSNEALGIVSSPSNRIKVSKSMTQLNVFKVTQLESDKENIASSPLSGALVGSPAPGSASKVKRLSAFFESMTPEKSLRNSLDTQGSGSTTPSGTPPVRRPRVLGNVVQPL